MWEMDRLNKKEISKELAPIGGQLLLCGLVFLEVHILVRCRVNGIARLNQPVHNRDEGLFLTCLLE